MRRQLRLAAREQSLLQRTLGGAVFHETISNEIFVAVDWRQRRFLSFEDDGASLHQRECSPCRLADGDGVSAIRRGGLRSSGRWRGEGGDFDRCEANRSAIVEHEGAAVDYRRDPAGGKTRQFARRFDCRTRAVGGGRGFVIRVFLLRHGDRKRPEGGRDSKGEKSKPDDCVSRAAARA